MKSTPVPIGPLTKPVEHKQKVAKSFETREAALIGTPRAPTFVEKVKTPGHPYEDAVVESYANSYVTRHEVMRHAIGLPHHLQKKLSAQLLAADEARKKDMKNRMLRLLQQQNADRGLDENGNPLQGGDAYGDDDDVGDRRTFVDQNPMAETAFLNTGFMQSANSGTNYSGSESVRSVASAPAAINTPARSAALRMSDLNSTPPANPRTPARVRFNAEQPYTPWIGANTAEMSAHYATRTPPNFIPPSVVRQAAVEEAIAAPPQVRAEGMFTRIKNIVQPPPVSRLLHQPTIPEMIARMASAPVPMEETLRPTPAAAGGAGGPATPKQKSKPKIGTVTMNQMMATTRPITGDTTIPITGDTTLNESRSRIVETRMDKLIKDLRNGDAKFKDVSDHNKTNLANHFGIRNIGGYGGRNNVVDEIKLHRRVLGPDRSDRSDRSRRSGRR